MLKLKGNKFVCLFVWFLILVLLTSNLAISQQGLVYGLLFSGYGFGGPIVSSFSSVFVSKFGFPWLFVLLASEALLCILLALFFIKDSPFSQFVKQLKKEKTINKSLQEVAEEEARKHGQEIFPDNSSDVANLLASVTSWKSLALTWVAAVTLGVYLCLLVFLPTFFTSLFNISQTDADWTITAYGFIGSVCLFGYGYLGRRVWLIGCVLGLLFSSNFWLSAVLSVLIVIFATAANISCFKLIDQVCLETAAATVGIIETLGNFIGFLLPLTFSLINPVNILLFGCICYFSFEI